MNIKKYIGLLFLTATLFTGCGSSSSESSEDTNTEQCAEGMTQLENGECVEQVPQLPDEDGNCPDGMSLNDGTCIEQIPQVPTE